MPRIVLLAAALVLTGCASMTPVDTDALAEVQAFADAIAREYSFPAVQVAVREGSSTWGRIPLVGISHAVLVAPLPIRDAQVARLLAFWVIKPPEPRTEAQEEEINRSLYPARNVVAVDILTRVKGVPEPIAAATVHVILAGMARGVAEKEIAPTLRAPHPCAQLLAFIARFPNYQLNRTPWCS